MKQKLNLIAIVALFVVIITSCSKDLVPGGAIEPIPGLNGLRTYTFEPTEITLSSFDSIGIKGFAKNGKLNSLTFLRDSIWPNNTGKTSFYETTDIPAVLEETRRKLYLGAILRGETAIDVNNVNPVFVPATMRNPITMYANFPTDSIYRTVIPSKVQDLSYLRAALSSAAGNQIQSFTYEQSQFRKTEELKKSFGANLNLGNILTINYLDSLNNTNFTTLVRAEFTQENFSIAIEPPIYEPYLKSNFDYTIFNGIRPVIVSSVTYGRKGIFIMESDSSYTMVKNTLNVALTLSAEMLNVSSVDSLGPAFSASLKLRLTKEQKATLENSRMKVYIIGADGKSIVKAITTGLEGFAEVLAGNGGFTKDSPGDILYYSLNYLDDFSTFRNQFKLNIPN